MNTISLKSTVVRKDDNLMGGEMGNETVLMDMSSGDYLGLNQVGSSIWNMIVKPITVSDICDSLMEKYEVDTKTCETETLKYLNQLVAENMINVQ
ncbi:MAG: lasso peptide biosynthesis PqqD family chaperone [Saprospiraceae bacterium]